MTKIKEQIVERFLQQAVVIDTESTGIDPKVAEICEIGHAISQNEKECTSISKLFGTKELIPFAASSKNNISRLMLNGLPTIEDGIDSVTNLLFLNDKEIQYVAAHNYNYDITILTSSFDRMNRPDLTKKVTDKKWICTYRLAQHLFKVTEENKDFGYSLSYLRYAFDLPVGELGVHRAGDDSAVCWHLLRYISYFILDTLDEEELTLDFDLGEFLHELSKEPIEFTVMPWGKHKGQALKDVPQSYYDWMLKSSDMLNEKADGYNADFALSVEKELNRRMNN